MTIQDVGQIRENNSAAYAYHEEALYLTGALVGYKEYDAMDAQVRNNLIQHVESQLRQNYPNHTSFTDGLDRGLKLHLNQYKPDVLKEAVSYIGQAQGVSEAAKQHAKASYEAQRAPKDTAETAVNSQDTTIQVGAENLTPLGKVMHEVSGKVHGL